MNNLLAPILRPDLPNYPVHIQVCRVTSSTVPGPAGYGSSAAGLNLYVSFTEQFQPSSLQPRDREPCLVVDLNGKGLSPGYYVCRLCGSYTDLPVYEAGGASLGGSSGGGGISATQTTNNFIIPAAAVAAGGGSSGSAAGAVSVNVLDTSALSIGLQIEISDGASIVVGTVVSVVNSTTFLLQTLQIIKGSIGGTMFAGALLFICCPIPFSSTTYSAFTIPGFNAQVTIQVTKTNWMVPGMELVVTDGIKTLFGVIDTIRSTTTPPTVTISQTRLDAGIVGEQMSAPAMMFPAPTALKTYIGASFTIPDIGNPVTVTVTSTGWMQSGQEYLITDGTNFLYGFAVPTAGNAVTFYPTLITGGGGTGNTVSKNATMVPMKSPENIPTTIAFISTAVGSPVTVNLLTTSIYKDYDTVTIYDGTSNIFGWITVTSNTSISFRPIYFFGGSPTTVVKTRAIVKKCCVSINPLLGKPFLTLNQTFGFPWFPAMHGVPVGVPAPLFEGFIPFVANIRDPSFWKFISSTWVSPTAGVLGASIASATTTDLATASGDFMTVTGNTAITSFGTITAGMRKTLKFASNPLITYSPGSIVLPNGVNITAAPGDVMELVSEGGGTVRCKNYERASNGFITVADSGTMTMDMSLGNTMAPSGKFYLPAAGNRTLEVTNFVDGSVLYLVLAPTGAFTIVWFANILWNGGAAPTQTAAAGKKDAFMFIYNAALSRWLDGGKRLNLF